MTDFPIDFDKCPICGCRDTVTRLAIKKYKESGKVNQNAFASAKKEAVPLIQPAIAVATVPTLIRHFDTCAKCGMEYCTRAEILEAAIRFSPQPGQGQAPFGGMPFGRG